MKVNTNSKEYDVKWDRWWISNQYAQNERHPHNVEKSSFPLPFEMIAGYRDKKLMVTKCIIREVDNSKQGKDKYIPVYQGIAVQSPSDNPNKFIGRKHSLTRAVSFFAKDARKQFWRVFAQEQMKINA